MTLQLLAGPGTRSGNLNGAKCVFVPFLSEVKYKTIETFFLILACSCVRQELETHHPKLFLCYLVVTMSLLKIYCCVYLWALIKIN